MRLSLKSSADSFINAVASYISVENNGLVDLYEEPNVVCENYPVIQWRAEYGSNPSRTLEIHVISEAAFSWFYLEGGRLFSVRKNIHRKMLSGELADIAICLADLWSGETGSCLDSNGEVLCYG